MKYPHFLTVLVLFVLPVLISCAAKTPGTDSQEIQIYNLEDLPLSDNLVKQIKSGDEQKYIMYTFYSVGNKNKIHKQYWEGLIVFDDLPLPDQVTTTTDNSGNKTIDWRENPLRKSHSKDIYNVNGVLVRRTTINPDGSAVYSVDRTGDGVVDYMEAFLPNGDEMIIASDPLGIDYLKDIFEGTNDHCRNSELFRAMSKNMPGCGSSGSIASSGPGGADNPYDDLMTGLCEGYESRGSDRWGSANRVVTHTNDHTTVREEGVLIDLNREDYLYEDGRSETILYINKYYDSGYREEIVQTTISNPDLSTRTRTYTRQIKTDRSESFTVTERVCNPSGSCQTVEHGRVTNPDGSHEHLPETQTECDNSGNCTSETIPPPASDTDHPGFDPDHNEAMAEFCETWRQSQEDRPNDVSELNERANEERCNIEPDEAGATDESSLAESCYLDIEGRDEIAEMIAAGTCVTATGGAHFDYDSESPRRCVQNKFLILEHGLLMNGPSGVSAAELCDDDFACDPADF